MYNIWIADLGKSPEIFINGKTEVIHRYAVWKKSETRIIETSDDLDYLLKKYKLSMAHVLRYKSFL
ncbi:hypothetical protein [Oxalobacter paraformigenes]|uniref:Uncharacterized protein n=1 Tax=Oxalobacter paraformigenes TaxID=556268 RepID=C3X2J4_9BURK|nr:hypothetical protein [Oxalobacter paraformigenes]EEO27430.1 hypothetical protein OFAG_00583 [Oxalobacter paraformigenes]